MLTRLASFAMVSMFLLAGCDPCDSDHGVREPELVVVLDDPEGSLLDEAAAEAVLDAGTVQVCWNEHEGRECAVLSLRDVLADGETGSQARLDLDKVEDGVSPSTADACLSAGLELTVEAPDCFSEPYALPLENASDGEATGERKSLRLECEG